MTQPTRAQGQATTEGADAIRPFTVHFPDEALADLKRRIAANELYQAPESWTKRAYPKLVYYKRHDKGGHFAAWEQPELLVSDLRPAFKSLRDLEVPRWMAPLTCASSIPQSVTSIRKGSAMKRRSILAIAMTTVALAALGGTVVYAQDKYSLKTPSGISFSEFKGYENWVVVSSTHTPNDRLKVMVANPTMIEAYRAGIPGNGQPFPDGSKIAKLQWKFKKSTEAPFDANVPDTFAEVFLMQKDSKRFPDSGGWGYALFNYDPATDKFAADPSPANCGHTCHVAVKAKDYIFHPYQKR